MISKSHYDTMKEHFAKMEVSIEDIDNFSLEESKILLSSRQQET
ncbi:MAG: hypothetical protein ABFS56_28300 [Pseudomonadota bacterium]